MADINKCGHQICNCAVDGEDKYCSDHCREATEQEIVEISCDCGDPACQ